MGQFTRPGARVRLSPLQFTQCVVQPRVRHAVAPVDNINSGMALMDKDRMSGTAKQAKGSMKEAAGRVSGDTKLKAEGKAEKGAGKVQSTVGGAKDAAKRKS